eukprot:UN2317
MKHNEGLTPYLRVFSGAERRSTSVKDGILSMACGDDEFKLTRAQFDSILGTKAVQSLLDKLEIDELDRKGLFEVLDRDSSGTLTIKELISGLMAVRGQAEQVGYRGDNACSEVRAEELAHDGLIALAEPPLGGRASASTRTAGGGGSGGDDKKTGFTGEVHVGDDARSLQQFAEHGMLLSTKIFVLLAVSAKWSGVLATSTTEWR